MQVEVLEDRRCPTAILFAGFVPSTAMLNISEMFSSGGPASSLTISGNTPSGGGVTSMITVQGGVGTTLNGMNGITFTTAFPGAIAFIHVTMLNADNGITVGTPTGIVNLPNTTLSVTEGSGNDTFSMGSYASGSVPAVNNVLGAVTWKTANLNSTGTESVSINNASVASVNVQENSGPRDLIQLWDVRTGGQVILNQNHGDGDTISVDRVARPPNSLGLVQNGDFETGDSTSWTLSGTANAFVTTGVVGYVPHNGTFFAALGADVLPGTVSQTLTTTPGQTYTLSFCYSSNGIHPAGFPSELKASVGGNQVFDVVNPPSTLAGGNNGYVNFTTTFTATSASTLLQFTERDDASFLALDDVSVVALPPPPPNLLANPGFEAGDFTGWTPSSNASAFVSDGGSGYGPHGGNHLTALGHSGLPLGTLSQTVPTIAGAGYVLSFWYASNGFGPNELKASLGGTTVFDQANIPSTLTPANAAQTGYVQFSTGFTATDASTLLQFGERDDLSFLALDDVDVSVIASSGGSGTSLPPPPPPAATYVTQGNGNNDNTTINRSQVLSLNITQGNGGGDGVFLGTGVTVGYAGDGSVSVVQGTGSADYVGVDNLSAGVVSLIQQDLAANATGDTIGGVATNVIVPGNGAGFPAPGLDKPSDLVPANYLTPALAAPSNGLANAVLQQLTITQGAAPGDVVSLEQLPSGVGANRSLTVAGTLTIRQQDVVGQGRDLIFVGSCIPGTTPSAPGFPPIPFAPALATGSVTAGNEVVTQGDGSGDVLSVLFNTVTSSAMSSQFTQGNGGDRAVFQKDTAVAGVAFNYTGGSGGNEVEADSNNAAGTFDGGTSVANNRLGQDYNSPLLGLVDFGKVVPYLTVGAQIEASYAVQQRVGPFINVQGSGGSPLPFGFDVTSPLASDGASIEVYGSASASGVSSNLVVTEQYGYVFRGVSSGAGSVWAQDGLTYSVVPDVASTLVFSWLAGGGENAFTFEVGFSGGQQIGIGGSNFTGSVTLPLSAGQPYSINIGGEDGISFPNAVFPSANYHNELRGIFGFTLTPNVAS